MSGPVRSVSHAFTILRLLAGDSPISLTGVCRETGLSASSALNLLRTLVGEGAVEREDDGRRYRLTPAWQSVDVLTGARMARLIAQVQPLIARFAKANDSACGLWQQVSRDRLALVALGESEATTRIHMAIGQRQPVGGGSVGRALVGAMATDHADLERWFARLRWHRPLAFAAWVEQVARARQTGFGLDEGYVHPGVVSVGVVVPGNRTPRLCLSASVFAGERSAADIEALGQALATLAKARDFLDH